ncbi:MAG: hypothetical protein AABW89_05640 [Nanoarchaeota archaeon]
MENQQITLENINHRLILLEKALKLKGIFIEEEECQNDDEGEFTDEFKERLQKARKTPLSEYISHEEVKRRILNKKK